MTNAAPSFVVHCPSCRSSFPIDPEKVPLSGIPALCSACLRVFTVRVPSEDSEDWRLPVQVVPQAAPEDEFLVLPADLPEEIEIVEEVPAEVPPPELEPPEASAPPEVIHIEVPEAPPPIPSRPAAFEDLTSLASEAMADPPSLHPDAAEVGGSRTVASGADRFGRRDPKDRARHLARVLVSDIIAYYPERYRDSFARGTLKDDFRTEVEKSWKEYVDQVGLEMAESTPFFKEALNEVLGKGTHRF